MQDAVELWLELAQSYWLAVIPLVGGACRTGQYPKQASIRWGIDGIGKAWRVMFT